jgi:hypothetical protein
MIIVPKSLNLEANRVTSLDDLLIDFDGLNDFSLFEELISNILGIKKSRLTNQLVDLLSRAYPCCRRTPPWRMWLYFHAHLTTLATHFATICFKIYLEDMELWKTKTSYAVPNLSYQFIYHTIRMTKVMIVCSFIHYSKFAVHQVRL